MKYNKIFFGAGLAIIFLTKIPTSSAHTAGVLYGADIAGSVSSKDWV